MNGFFITVSNGLLEGDHRKKMGSAVWEFMWLLDKITSVSEEGLGTVMGGKPIKLRDISTGIAENNISQNLIKLQDEGYINIKHAPYGLIITINKAQKIFNQKVKKKESSINENVEPHNENVEPNIKDIRQDNKTNNTDVETALPVSENIGGKRFNNLIYEFRHINPSYQKLFSDKTQRKALEELVNQYGFDRMENLLKILPKIMEKPYAPRISTPYALQKKMGDLIIFIKQSKSKGGGTIDARHVT